MRKTESRDIEGIGSWRGENACGLILMEWGNKTVWGGLNLQAEDGDLRLFGRRCVNPLEVAEDDDVVADGGGAPAGRGCRDESRWEKNLNSQQNICRVSLVFVPSIFWLLPKYRKHRRISNKFKE